MKPKLKMPFKKGSHARIISEIARGMHETNQLNNYLELGVQRGTTFNVVAPFARKAYAVDIDDNKSFISSHKNLIWYRGKTLDFLSQADLPKFDLVFIDADHTHEASLSDFKAVRRWLRTGSIVILHDTYPPTREWTHPSYCGQVYKTAEFIRENFKEFEMMTLPFYCGLTLTRLSSGWEKEMS